jgi:hypothetical protein
MQKKIIALAIAGLASTAAFAQSNVTIYGRMDLGAAYRQVVWCFRRRQPTPKVKYEMASGIGSGSRIGFKGVEDLGNGLKAVFQSEFGIDARPNLWCSCSATWTNRNTYARPGRRFRYRRCWPSDPPAPRHGAKVELMPGASGVGTTMSVTGRIGGPQHRC